MIRRRMLGLALGALAISLVTALTASAAPTASLKQFRVPTDNSSPLNITRGSDGNLWFTEGFVEPPQGEGHNVARITPSGDITEFLVCDFCFPNDIVQGPNGILYFTKSDPAIGRIRTTGEVLPDIQMPNSLANGSAIAARGGTIWTTDFNTDSVWRYRIGTGEFTQFPLPAPSADPLDLAIDANGIVWVAEFGAGRIARLDPVTGVITETVVGGDPRQIAIATDGSVWFTERFTNAVGRLDPATGQVTQFPLAPGAGPEGIAAAPDGTMWIAQFNAGNIANIRPDGTITEGKSVKRSGPTGVVVAPDGNPWYTELRENKIAVLQLR